MNRTLKTILVLMPGIATSAILMAISAGGMVNQEAMAQTANATTNATAPVNQTGPDFGNITSADFSTTLDNIEAVTECNI